MTNSTIIIIGPPCSAKRRLKTILKTLLSSGWQRSTRSSRLKNRRRASHYSLRLCPRPCPRFQLCQKTRYRINLLLFQITLGQPVVPWPQMRACQSYRRIPQTCAQCISVKSKSSASIARSASALTALCSETTSSTTLGWNRMS